jgi:dipeptidyl aminopeptidase/acylaminoacyl peptidase
LKSADLPLLWELSRPRISADGLRVAVAEGRVDLQRNCYVSDIWVMPSDGSAPPQRFTHGQLDSEPSWSPDGRWLSFTRAQPRTKGLAGKPQLYLMSTNGGEPFPLTDHALGVSGAVWSPRGDKIAYLARVPEQGRYGTDPNVPANEEPPRRIRELSYKRDLIGYKIDQRRHVFVLDVPADPGETRQPDPVQLTEGDFDHAYLSWAPSGAELVMISARHADRDVNLVQDVFAVALADRGLRQLTDTSTVISRPTFSPDGEAVVFLGFKPGKSGRDVFGMSSALWEVPAREKSSPRQISVPGAALPSDRSPDLPSTGALIVDNDGVLVEQESRGAVQLVRVTRDGQVHPLIAGPRQVLGFDTVADVVVAAIGSDLSCGEIVRVKGSEETVLTDFGKAAHQKIQFFGVEEVTGTANDGYPVHGFLVKPHGPAPHPLIVFINGGPFVQAGWHLSDEAQVYAEAGYAVLFTNERGRCGYGEEHGRAVMGRMASVGSGDILSLLDKTLESPGFDPSRVAVMGGSYGGFMTSWLVTQTDRFATAISERALNDWDRSGDIGYYYPDYYIGETAEEMRASSPIAHADKITTPMLLVHSEDDLDTPLNQAERLFFTLKLRGVEVEMLIFPGEGHGLTRSGLPTHRVARFDAIVEWLDKWLEPERISP